MDLNEFGYTKIPGLKALTRMKTCRQYSNLPPLYRSLWDEYRNVRVLKKKLEDVRKTLPADKPRFKLVDGKPRRVVHVGADQMNYVELFKATQRLKEIAHYFWIRLKWIAPDFTEEELVAETSGKKD